MTSVAKFAEIEDQFNDYVGDIVYATMTTVDARSRPRARILIPVWETVEGRPLGWLATYKTPSKRPTWPEIRTRRSRTGRLARTR